MSKDSDERCTPDELFNELHAEFKFDIDIAASDSNHKLPVYYTKDNPANKYSWPLNCFLNPPYSELKYWLKLAAINSLEGSIVVLILPNDSSTEWFHRYIWDKELHKPYPGIQIRYPDKRYKFSNDNSAKFATMLVIMNLKDSGYIL